MGHFSVKIATASSISSQDMSRELIEMEGRVSQSAIPSNKYYGRKENLGQQSLPFNSGQEHGSNFRDPAFSDNKVQPIHRWVPWIAGFSSQFVEDCFQTFLSDRCCHNNPLVLDPFAGVGTTLVSALLKGYASVGFDINAYAALASKVKLAAALIDPAVLENLCLEYREKAPTFKESDPSLKPSGFRTKIPFFSSDVERQVLAVLEFIQHIPDPLISDVFRVALGSVMISFSNYTYEPSLTSRPGAGKPLIQQADVPGILLKKLKEIQNDILWLKGELSRIGHTAASKVYNMDFMSSHDVLESNSVDLMVSSPPYMNNYHYVRNTRPQLYWLSLVSNSNDLRELEEANVGKYWQTVRAASPQYLQFKHDDLSRMLGQLRKTRTEKGVYGGSGWANYVTCYFNDSLRFLQTLKRSLKRNAYGVIVIGNSIIQGFEFQTDYVLAELAVQIGLKLEGIQRIRNKRVGASITRSAVRRGDDSKAVLYESAVIIRKR